MSGAVSRLPHGHTNATSRSTDGTVEKRFVGAERKRRFDAEVQCLRGLASHIPVPGLVDLDEQRCRVRTAWVEGQHGQDLIEAGHAVEVMGLVGSILAQLQLLPTNLVPGLAGPATAIAGGDPLVIAHGDFGPQNMLFDLAGPHSRGVVLDWEFAHLGRPIEDLAWAEWIVRMHHPRHVDAAEDLLIHAGSTADWSARQEAMVGKCTAMLRFCDAAANAEGAALWRDRVLVTERWSE